MMIPARLDAVGDSRFWPAFRLRKTVHAKRVPGGSTIGGRFYKDGGYLLRDGNGDPWVMPTGEFEALYESMSRDES
jgi:hypothetical protein